MKYAIFSLFLLGMASPVLSQTDVARIDSLNARAFSFIGNAPDSMITIAEKALYLSKRIGYRKGEAFALNRIAIGKHLRGETNSIDILEEALAIQTELKEDLARIGTLNNMANIHIATGAYVFAGVRLHEALATYAALGDSVGMSNAWNNLGNLHRSIGKLDIALEYNQMALSFRERLGDTLLLSSSLNNVGNLLTDMDQLEEAKSHHERALALNRAIGDKRSIANSLHNLGTIYNKQKNYRIALEYYQNAAAIREEIKDMRALTSALTGQGEAYIGLINYAEAVAAAELSYRLARQIGVPKEALEASRIAYLAYRDGGNAARALEFLEIFKHLSDSLVTLDRQKAIASLENVAEINRKQNEIDRLEQERSYQVMRMIGVLIGLAITLILLGWIWRASIRERRISEELRLHGAMKDRMFSILSHDLRTPPNSLHSLIELLDMDVLTPEEWASLKSALLRQFVVTDETLRDVLLWSKGQFEGEKPHFQTVKLKEVVDANLELVFLIANRKGISITTEVDPDSTVTVDRNHLMAIVRNLLSNAVKFTPKGKSITIRCESANGHHRLTVQDESVGMSKETLDRLFITSGQFNNGTSGETGSGLGLIFVSELVRQNNGTIQVQSTPGEGSVFNVSFQKG